MKKIFIVFLFLSALVSCEDITDLNDNPKKAKEAPAATLFANAQKNLSDIITDSNVNLNVFRLISQQWTQTTYTNESRYDLSTRNIPQEFWHQLYRDVLKDLDEATKSVNAIDPLFIDEGVRKNQLALIEFVDIYTWLIVVNTYGDVPYKGKSIGEALDINVITPKYEDAAAIYDDLIVRLDDALNAIDETSEAFGTSDIFYKSDMVSWTKFGNSLKLKIGMLLADSNPGKAKDLVEEASSNVIDSVVYSAIIKYKETTPNTNPYYVDQVLSSRKDFVGANTLINTMTSLSDPRLSFYFSTVDTVIFDAYENGAPAEGAHRLDTVTVYVGGKYGSKNAYDNYSKPSDKVRAPDFQAVLFDYAEVEFYLAEAKERGMTVDGTAEEHYNKAITISMGYWGVSEADIATYLLRPDVAYATAAGNFKEKIGRQFWIALYNRGYDAWTEFRRLNFPNLVAPETALSGIPVRYTYPVSEQNLNQGNYEAASAKIGGDVVETKLFWDIN